MTKAAKAFALAEAEIGTLEKAGKEHNPKIVAYFKDAGNAGVKDDETAWCAAFVGAMLERAGIRSTRKLNARSYLEWGEKISLDDAEKGDIVIFQRGTSAWQGHVGFYVGHGASKITVLGGNQSNKVSLAPYPMSKLLGVRRAVEAKIKTPSPSPAKKHGGAAIVVGGGAVAGAALWTWACKIPLLASLFSSCGG